MCVCKKVLRVCVCKKVLRVCMQEGVACVYARSRPANSHAFTVSLMVSV